VELYYPGLHELVFFGKTVVLPLVLTPGSHVEKFRDVGRIGYIRKDPCP
jgi:hypothetical protein